MARPALASLACRGKTGSGFFVAPDLLLTNAHVTCGKEATLEVKLDGGRRLLGRVRALDEWLDFAVVEVTGAGVAAPLALGDSTRLEAGDPVVLAGSPLGLDATLHAGRVSFAARNLEGVVHVQVNADVNPGNSGGPLLDAEGRAVGIVTLRAEGASGVGFALPVEYARAALELPEADAAARERWDAAVARAAEEDGAEATRLVARLERPLLLAVDAAGARLGLLVMHRWPAGPSPIPLPVELRDGERLVCELEGEVRDWAALAEQLEELARHEGARRRVRWMVRRGISKDAYAGVALVDPSRCPSPPPASARVSLRGAPDEAPPFPAAALAEGSRRAAEHQEAAVQLEEHG
jgi:serine protease Do